MLNLLLATAFFLPQGPSTAPVVINEFSYDDGGTDDLEFVELYNRSAAPVDLSGWRIRNPDATGITYGAGSGVDPTYTIPQGTILQPGAFVVFGAASTLLAQNLINIGTTNLLENDNEAIELVDLGGVVVDSVLYEAALGLFGPHPLEGDGIYGDLAVGGTAPVVGGIPTPIVPTSSIGRLLDGWDTNDNGRDFLCNMTPTPGGPNTPTGAIPYVETFDLGAPGVAVPGWTRGWVLPVYVDPTAPSSQNLSVKPVSPQGGLALSTWDNSGGGNSVMLDVAPMADVVVESYVWIEPTMTPVNPAPYTPAVPPVLLDHYNIGDGEWWALGVRGTAGANGNPPNVGNYFGTISLGVGNRPHYVTGICWAHFRTPTFSRLYLLDMNNGASVANPLDFTILAGPIDILPGINDGWQRLRLHVQGEQVVGNFGGTYGFDDGQRFTATTSTTGPGSVYIAYREALLYNNNGQAGCRPPLFDLLDVHAPTTALAFLGTASPTTAGTPNIFSDGLPIVGSTGWAIRASGMVPQGAPNSFFCGIAYGFSSFAPGYPIGGAPATAFGYVLPIVASNIGFADPTGNVGWAFPLPPAMSLLGLTIVSQVIDYDPFLAANLPIGLSRGLEATVGN